MKVLEKTSYQEYHVKTFADAFRGCLFCSSSSTFVHGACQFLGECRMLNRVHRIAISELKHLVPTSVGKF